MIEHRLKQIIIRCKYNYKQKIETKMRDNNLRQAWQGVYTMIGQERSKSFMSNHGDDLAFAN